MRKRLQAIRERLGIPSRRVILHFVVLLIVGQSLWWVVGKVFSAIPEIVIGWGFLAVFIATIFAVAWYLPKLSLKSRRATTASDKKEPTDEQKERVDLLLEVLEFNQRYINIAVNGHISRWNFSGLKVIEAPFFEIHFQLFNTSIFTLDFNGVEGAIKVGGITCQTTKPTANSPQRAIIQGQEFYVIVTQAVLPDMAKKILEAGSNREKLTFDLRQLTLNIETVTEGYKGLKPNIKFDSDLTPDIATWLSLQDAQKIGYWS